MHVLCLFMNECLNEITGKAWLYPCNESYIEALNVHNLWKKIQCIVPVARLCAWVLGIKEVWLFGHLEMSLSGSNEVYGY